jgi:DNA repair protein RadC
MPKPHAASYRDYVRKRTTQLIHEGHEADQAYAIANSEARKMFPGSHEEEATEESPTRDPWVVAVKTTEPDKVQRLAGIRGEVRHLEKGGSRVLFTFYDDELSRSLASRLTRAGYIVTWGPEKAVAAEEEGTPTVVGLEPSLSKAERTKLEREVWKKTPADDRAVIRGEKSVLVDTDTSQGGRFTTTYPLSKVSDAKLRELLHGQQSHAAEAPFTAPERNPKDVDAGKKYGTAKDARAVYDMLHEQLNKESQEVFLVLPLDLHGDLLSAPVEVARGQRDRVSVDPSDVLRSVISTNASGFIVIHNHPSGHSKPSDADRDLTKRIKQATKPFEPVVLIDHVIVGRREYYSIQEDKHYKVK